MFGIAPVFDARTNEAVKNLRMEMRAQNFCLVVTEAR